MKIGCVSKLVYANNRTKQKQVRIISNNQMRNKGLWQGSTMPSICVQVKSLPQLIKQSMLGNYPLGFLKS